MEEIPLHLNSLINLEGDHTLSGRTLGDPNTGSTVAGALLGSPGENVAKVGTILAYLAITLPTPFDIFSRRSRVQQIYLVIVYMTIITILDHDH